MQTPSKRIALITGANKGIGFEIARQIGQRGVTVLVGARNKAAGDKAATTLAAEGIDARFVAIDVADYASIEASAVLTSSSTMRVSTIPLTARLDAVERVFRTNFLGALAVTQAMLPLLRKSTAARIVNVSSGLGSLALNGDPSYP